MPSNEQPELDPELSDKSLNEIVGIESAKIADEFRKKTALYCIDFLVGEKLFTDETMLGEMPKIIEKYLELLRKRLLADKSGSNDKYKILNYLNEAKGALQTLKNSGINPLSNLEKVKEELKSKIKKAEDNIEQDEENKRGK